MNIVLQLLQDGKWKIHTICVSMKRDFWMVIYIRSVLLQCTIKLIGRKILSIWIWYFLFLLEIFYWLPTMFVVVKASRNCGIVLLLKQISNERACSCANQKGTWKVHSIGAWEKNNSTCSDTNLSGLGYYLCLENIICFWKRAPRFSNNCTQPGTVSFSDSQSKF